MSVEGLLQHRCTLHSWTASGTDAYGNQSANFNDVVNVPCFIQSGSARRRTDQGQYVTTRSWTGYFLPNTVIKERDELTWDGRRLVVDTVVGEQSPRGTNQQVAALREP